MTPSQQDHDWYLYALQCSNNAIYIGITNNIGKRLLRHQAGKGSKYVRSWKPFRLVAKIKCRDTTEARRLEYRLKHMDKKSKMAELKRLSA